MLRNVDECNFEALHRLTVYYYVRADAVVGEWETRSVQSQYCDLNDIDDTATYKRSRSGTKSPLIGLAMPERPV